METFQEKLKILNQERIMAAYEESVIRESCFLPITLEITGIEIKQFNFQHYVLLDFLKNPLLSGDKDIKPEDILTFLWIVSINYKPNDKTAFNSFVVDKCSAIDYVKAYEEIVDYLNKSLLDLVPSNNTLTSKKTNKISSYSWIVSYVDLLGFQYGWSVEYIMTLPVALVLQLSRIIEERLAGKPVEFKNQLSDVVQGKIVQLLQENGEQIKQKLVLPDK